MNNDKAPTYRYDQNGWIPVTFADLKPDDLIKIYKDLDETILRGNRYWRVKSEPYHYEKGNMGIEAEPVDNPAELQLDEITAGREG